MIDTHNNPMIQILELGHAIISNTIDLLELGHAISNTIDLLELGHAISNTIDLLELSHAILNTQLSIMWTVNRKLS